MNAMIAPGLPKEVLNIVTKVDAIDAIESIIIAAHGLNFFKLGVKTRKPIIVRARKQACYLLYVYTLLSLEEIMLLFYPALKDHTSVLFGVHSVDTALGVEHLFKNQYILHGLQECLNSMYAMPVVKVKYDGVWRLKSEII